MRRTVTIVGAGYVGLAVSIVLSENNNIILYDIDKNKVDKLNSGLENRPSGIKKSADSLHPSRMTEIFLSPVSVV